MTPITEDHVVKIMKGLQAREKDALKRLAHKAEKLDVGGRMTACVLDYKRAESEDRPLDQYKGGPISLDEARAARKARRAVRGYFFYIQNAG